MERSGFRTNVKIQTKYSLFRFQFSLLRLARSHLTDDHRAELFSDQSAPQFAARVPVSHRHFSNKRWTPIIGQPKDDMSAFLHYSGEKESEKEAKIAQAWV